MKIEVTFPSVMKMNLFENIELDEPVTMDIVRQKVYDAFWSHMKLFSSSGIHGTPAMVILQDKEGTVISTDDELQIRLKTTKNFIVVFDHHPSV